MQSTGVESEVYDSDPQLRHPGRFVRRVRSDLTRSWWLASQLLKQNVRGRYRRSALGYLWLLAAPTSIAAVWIFLHRSGIVSFGETQIPYALHVITGLFLWTAFLRMLNAPLQQLAASRHMLAKISFPWEALLLAGWAESLLEFLVFLAVLAVVLLAFGFELWIPLLTSLPVIGMLLILGAGIGLLLAPLGLLYEDVNRATSIITYGLFFLTPIIYPAPTTMPALLTLRLNPIGTLLVTGREVMTSMPLSSPGGALIASVLAVLLFLGAWICFRLAVPHLISKL